MHLEAERCFRLLDRRHRVGCPTNPTCRWIDSEICQVSFPAVQFITTFVGTDRIMDDTAYYYLGDRRPVGWLRKVATNDQSETVATASENVSDFATSTFYSSHKHTMVAQAPSGKKPLPDMMTSIRFTESGEVEMVDQLLLP